MKCVFDFIVKPLGDRYENEITIGDKKLTINSSIESFKSVNNFAIVVETPLAYKTEIQKGDIVIIHHNVFREFYDMKGERKNSRSFFKEDLYFCSLDQVYLYNRNNNWNSFGDRCFVSSIKSNDDYTLNKEQSLIGILKYGNSALEALGINEGDLVGYKPYGEFDFLVDGKRLYCMKSNDIVIKYEYQGNEEENNPSWAKSS
jgi:hypothetical protein